MFAFYSTTVGKKIVVAVTGLLLFGFVVGHMAGNLKAFGGADPESGIHKLDLYAEALRSVGAEFFGHAGLLWIARIGLLAALLLHILTVYRLRGLNTAARPVGYRRLEPSSSTLASRTMWWGGLFLMVFVVVHLLHLTFGTLHFQGFIEGAVFANITRTFRVWYITAFYAVAMAVLGLHLYHGVWSLCQTLGLDNPERNRYLRAASLAFALVIGIGFITVPVAIMTGLLSESTVASGDLF